MHRRGVGRTALITLVCFCGAGFAGVARPDSHGYYVVNDNLPGIETSDAVKKGLIIGAVVGVVMVAAMVAMKRKKQGKEAPPPAAADSTKSGALDGPASPLPGWAVQGGDLAMLDGGAHWASDLARARNRSAVWRASVGIIRR